MTQEYIERKLNYLKDNPSELPAFLEYLKTVKETFSPAFQETIALKLAELQGLGKVTVTKTVREENPSNPTEFYVFNKLSQLKNTPEELPQFLEYYQTISSTLSPEFQESVALKLAELKGLGKVTVTKTVGEVAEVTEKKEVLVPPVRKCTCGKCGVKKEDTPIIYGKTKRYCFWSVGDGSHAKMLQTLVNSARRVGVTEDFHLWTDTQIEGENVFNHDCGSFNKQHYLFKFNFLQDKVRKLDYDYYVFLDADNIFVRHPGDLTSLLSPEDKVFVQMESDCTHPKLTRQDWWSCKIEYYPLLLWYKGVKTRKVWNTNAGFWIVKREHVDEFCNKGMEFWQWTRDNVKVTFTEEAPIAFLGHIMQSDPEKSSIRNTSRVWASDWTGVHKDKLPDGTSWEFEDYMTGEKFLVNPAIVHSMRGKDLLIKGI